MTGPFLVSISIFLSHYSFLFGSVRQIKLATRQLLGALLIKSIVSYHKFFNRAMSHQQVLHISIHLLQCILTYYELSLAWKRQQNLWYATDSCAEIWTGLESKMIIGPGETIKYLDTSFEFGVLPSFWRLHIYTVEHKNSQLFCLQHRKNQRILMQFTLLDLKMIGTCDGMNFTHLT